MSSMTDRGRAILPAALLLALLAAPAGLAVAQGNDDAVPAVGSTGRRGAEDRRGVAGTAGGAADAGCRGGR